MKIETFLRQSPLFEISWAARQVEGHLARQLSHGEVSFLEALVLVSIVFEKPMTVSPSRLAAAFSTTRGNISHCISSLEAKGLLARRIDPEDARAYQLLLKPQGKRIAMQMVRSLDHMQTCFEKTIGSAKLEAAIEVVRQVEQVCSQMRESERPPSLAARTVSKWAK
ncbi:MAG: MarR family transcriptional regulator [Terriglobales bacterium]|jgi:DNA-binding MarR family transcriptional regulator